MEYYVSCRANRGGNGTKENPFLTISEAAALAKAGDRVIVAPGIYREWVDPQNGGLDDECRISYVSEVPLGAVISGAERVRNWKKLEGTVWSARVSNGIFSDRNPYTTQISGDWFNATAMTAHTGDVYLNGKSLYEAAELDGVRNPVPSKASWDPEFSVYTWYCEQDTSKNETVFYANFQGLDPNEETVEVSARSACFYPKKEGVNYITLSGFRVCMAATQWAPPTAYQEGMIGPHWSKGWIIEDCEVFESKCSGISLGKYYQPENDNKWLHWKRKDGTQTERECILQAQREGWTKERIGSHIIRRCDIHDCGQTGIVGHLGAVFSLIEDNHIHHINNKQNLAGAEIGGIKIHAAIDVIFRRNHIHHCTRGMWLDWQAQGTRVTQNLFHDNTLPNLKPGEMPDPEALQGNGEDIFVEVSHGPTLIDNNILLSARALHFAAQGIAVVHNLIAGGLVGAGMGTDNGSKSLSSPRYTPYHVQHRTEVAGFMTFLHGDLRFFNNIFVQQPVHPMLVTLMDIMKDNEWEDGNIEVGTFPYHGYPTVPEWEKEFEGYCGMGSEPSDRYYMHLPIQTGGNVFANGAKPWEKETNFAEVNGVTLSIKEKEGSYFLETNLYDLLPELETATISTEMLGYAFEPEQKFENPDGTPILFDRDYFGVRRELRPLPGPFASGEETAKELNGEKRSTR